MRPALQAIVERSGTPFRGLLYAGLMMTRDGPLWSSSTPASVIRRRRSWLPRLGGDLLRLCLAAAEGDVLREPAPVERRSRLRGCAWLRPVTLAPSRRARQFPVSTGSTRTFWSFTPELRGVARVERLVTAGGRVLTVVARGKTVAEARAHVYANVEPDSLRRRTLPPRYWHLLLPREA